MAHIRIYDYIATIIISYYYNNAPSEAVLTICPCLPARPILSIAISAPHMTARMLTSMHLLQPWLALMPALLTRMSTHSTRNAASARSNSLRNSASLVTSHSTKTTFPGPNLSPSSAAAASPLSPLTSEMQTFAPSSSSLAAKALPRPWAGRARYDHNLVVEAHHRYMIFMLFCLLRRDKLSACSKEKLFKLDNCEGLKVSFRAR